MIFHQQQWHSMPELTEPVPAEFQYWLMLPGSLTAALKARDPDLRVQVIRQHWCDTKLPEFGISEPWWSREVLLMSGANAWVAAHTAIVLPKPQDKSHRLVTMGDSPLGEVLFKEFDLECLERRFCRVELGWGRLTSYDVQQAKVHISEFFLPDLIDYEHKRHSTLHQSHTN